MNEVIRGTNITIRFTVTDENLDLADMTVCNLYIKCAGYSLEKSMSDLTIDTTAKTISYTLAQAESLELTAKRNLTANIVALIDGLRYESRKISRQVIDTSEDEVIT